MVRPSGSERPDLPAEPVTPGPPNPMADPAFVAGLRPIPSGPLDGTEPWPASDIVGEDLDGHPVEVRLDALPGSLLLCFLHVRCDGCEEFWRGLGDGRRPEWPESMTAVAVTRGPGSVDRTEVARVAAGVVRVPVVMSDEAWIAYRVTGYPFFVLVDTALGIVVGETVGFGWSDVRSMIRAAGH